MADDFRLLYVCTANICRSTMAEAITRDLAWMPGVPGGRLLVSSAGLRARPGQAAADGTRDALWEIGVRVDGHRSRLLDRPLVDGSDLVLTTTRRQRSEVLALAPSAFRRTFTLPEFARLAGRLEVPSWRSSDSMAERAEALREQVAALRGRGPAGGDDIEDPYGRSRAAFTACVRQVLELVALIRPHLHGEDVHPDEERRTALSGSTGR